MSSGTDTGAQSDSDFAPMSPVSEDNELTPTIPLAPDGKAHPSAERKLTIRVPVEYTPPTPPPSAELPAIPPRRASLTTPVSIALRKRASAPVPSWSAAALPLPPASRDEDKLHAPPPEEPAASEDPAMPMPMPAVPDSEPHKDTTMPVPTIAVNTPQGTQTQPKIILMATSSTGSAIHLPTALKQSSSPAVPPRSELKPPPAKYGGAALLPTPPSPPSQSQSQSQSQYHATRTRPRRKSAPGRRDTLDAPPPPSPQRRVRNFPSHVSLIEFDSSSSEDDDDEDDDDRDGDESAARSVGSTSISIPEEEVEPRTPRAQKPDADADWAPAPTYFPTHQNISISTSYSNSHPAARQRSRASTTATTTSGRSARGTVNSRPRAPTPGAFSPMDADVAYTTQALMSPEMLARMLRDPLARQRFREFLAVDGGGGGGTAALDFWTDAQFLGQAIERLRAQGEAFDDLYLAKGSNVPRLAPDVRRELLGVLQRVRGMEEEASLGRTQSWLLEGLYNEQFQRFVKHKIIQEAHVTLGLKAGGMQGSGRETEGLGDTFVLTNPRLRDHPIVLVSDGFEAVTGYGRREVVGRNCRFLQGPGTPPASVQRIRDGLNSGKGCTELLLNYRRDGEPFYCLLCIIPVRDASGAIVYFIGGQTNVTGLLATDGGLGLGLGAQSAQSTTQMMQMSPALAMACGASSALPASTTTTPLAAGSVAGSSNSHPPPQTTSGGRFFRGLFGRASDGKQVIAGAEAMMNGNGMGARGLQDQYALFQNTYNKILIFKFKKREITFVSPQMLVYLGLPTRSPRELHASPLIRADVAALLTAGPGEDSRTETRRLRADLKDAVQRGLPCSLYCGVKIPGTAKGLLTRSDSTRHKFGMMHVTPIKDGDNVAVAFVAIFG
ncbi:hypothetical protein C8R46DRAFT_1344440 [Mycena filopes]|nr:hypothetical protein C8R46DRAFT_1344440 [Mycena filopes]